MYINMYELHMYLYAVYQESMCSWYTVHVLCTVYTLQKMCDGYTKIRVNTLPQ